MNWVLWVALVWSVIAPPVALVIGRTIRLADDKAEKAKLAAELIDEAEAVEQTVFMQGYVMGACTMAGQLELPVEVWASPERKMRREATRASESARSDQGTDH